MTLKELITKDIEVFRASGKFVVTAAEMAKSLRRASPSVRRAMAEMAATGLLKKIADGYVHPGATIRRGKIVAAVATAIATASEPVQPSVPELPPIVDGEVLPDPEVTDDVFEDEDELDLGDEGDDSTVDALDGDDE